MKQINLDRMAPVVASIVVVLLVIGGLIMAANYLSTVVDGITATTTGATTP